MPAADLSGEAIAWLLALHRQVYLGLGAHLRAIGEGSPAFAAAGTMAFLLGLLHALTPGHGKSVVFVYFLGRAARPLAGIAMGLRIALVHVATGVLVFLVLRAAMGAIAGASGREVGHGLRLASHALVALVGVWLAVRATRRRPEGPAVHSAALPAAVGLLPCPLTLLVLGYAVANATLAAGIALVAVMALGIAATLGSIGLVSILARRRLAAWLDADGAGFDAALRPLAVASAIVIVGIGAGFFVHELLAPRPGPFG